MPKIGFPELLIILGILVLLFGGKRIPGLMRGIGEGIRSFKDGIQGDSPDTPSGSKPAPPSAIPPEKK